MDTCATDTDMDTDIYATDTDTDMSTCVMDMDTDTDTFVMDMDMDEYRFEYHSIHCISSHTSQSTINSRSTNLVHDNCIPALM
jgi:hypothetical protein